MLTDADNGQDARGHDVQYRLLLCGYGQRVIGRFGVREVYEGGGARECGGGWVSFVRRGERCVVVSMPVLAA